MGTQININGKTKRKSAIVDTICALVLLRRKHPGTFYKYLPKGPAIFLNNKTIKMCSICLSVSFYSCGGMCKIYKCTKEGTDQESIQSSTTPDSAYHWESNKVTV